MEYGASCEYLPLKRVLMYRPGKEIMQLTVHSYRELSFRDVVYWKRFQQEHDAFCDLLRGENVEVILLNDYLSEHDLKIAGTNTTYTRDSGSVTRKGSVQMRMTYQVRTMEPLLVSKVLEKLGIPQLLSIEPPGMLEGGDFVYPDDETLMIGYGTRTNEQGAMLMAKTALENEVVTTVVLVPLPSWRVHLDGGMMFVDKDLVLYHPASVETYPARVLRKNESIELVPVVDYVKENFGAEMLPITDNELYLFGANVVCLDRRKCVIYEWNERIMDELQQRDVEVLPIEGYELARGGGGPHCMTLPILRKK
ncbi:MAG: arginine deiminase family protein [Candidatus Odinarchaeota archaeon]